MGQKLGRVEALLQHGVTAIPPDEGARLFCELLSRDADTPVRRTVMRTGVSASRCASIVVTGRVGNPPTLRLDCPPLPRGRFLNGQRVQYPVELICDTQLSADADPYANDDMLQGQRLFPAVVAFEAMAQVAMALARSSEPPGFENALFHRPVVVPESGQTTIRIQALMRSPGCVDLALLCSDTGFAVRHFETTCCFVASSNFAKEVNGHTEAAPSRDADTPVRMVGRADRSVRVTSHACRLEHEPQTRDSMGAPRELPLNISVGNAACVPLDPVSELYEERLFHAGRFRRVQSYRRLTATECVAEISGDGNAPWFRADLPHELVLGDAAGRNAALHAIQACIPHRRILPIGVARMVVSAEASPAGRVVWAKERERTADEFTYDVLVRDHDGRLLESWEGLRLRAVENFALQNPWPAPLLAAYLARWLADLLPGPPISAALLTDESGERPDRSAAALAQILGSDAAVSHRADGKPEVHDANGCHVSTAHAGSLTLAVSAARRVACDIESVKAWPPSEWAKLLSPEQRESAEAAGRARGEDFDAAATRVWAAAECLKKAGIPAAHGPVRADE